MVILHKRNASSVSRRSDQPDCHFVRNVECFDQNRFIALESNGIFHKKFGEIVESGVVHKTVTIPPSAADATQLIGQLELADANEKCRKSTDVMVAEGGKIFFRIRGNLFGKARPTVHFLPFETANAINKSTAEFR